MSLTFPLTLPAAGPAKQVFEPSRADFLSRENSGRIGGVSAGVPLWAASWTLGALSQAQSDAWRAFLAALNGPQNTFLGYEYGRSLPRAYPGGLPAGFAGAASSWSQAFPTGQPPVLTLHGLPNGLVLSAGDYVDFRWTSAAGTRRSLVRLLEGAVASGGAASAAITPAVPAVTPSDAVAHLDNPACLMRIVPTQTAVTDMDRRKVAGARIVALQDLRP